MTEHEKLLIAARYQPTTVGNMALDPRGGYCNYQAVEILRQRVQELENERLEQQEKLCGCIVNLGQLRAERDEWEANSGQWEQEYYKVSKERDEIAVEARRKQRNWISVCEERDALTKQRDELAAALEMKPLPYVPAIASVKEKK